jgi:L-ascorbate 6-phosphate lactonase
MGELGDRIEAAVVARGKVAIFWLGQAGFALKFSTGLTVYIDAYISYMCETTLAGGLPSKRLFPPPMTFDEIRSGLILSTHMHQDHNDEETIVKVVEHIENVRIIGPRSCIRALRGCGVPADRMHELNTGDTCPIGGGTLHAVYADHGEAEPDAVGFVLDMDDGPKIYNVGDTCFCPERMQAVIDMKPDIIIAPINGTYGNLDGVEAAKLAHHVGARLAIPCHFWMFPGQNRSDTGTPIAFVEAFEKHAPETEPRLMCVGECITWPDA